MVMTSETRRTASSRRRRMNASAASLSTALVEKTGNSDTSRIVIVIGYIVSGSKVTPTSATLPPGLTTSSASLTASALPANSRAASGPTPAKSSRSRC